MCPTPQLALKEEDKWTTSWREPLRLARLPLGQVVARTSGAIPSATATDAATKMDVMAMPNRIERQTSAPKYQQIADTTSAMIRTPTLTFRAGHLACPVWEGTATSVHSPCGRRVWLPPGPDEFSESLPYSRHFVAGHGVITEPGS